MKTTKNFTWKEQVYEAPTVFLEVCDEELYFCASVGLGDLEESDFEFEW